MNMIRNKLNTNNNHSNEYWLYGNHSCKAALYNHNREIKKILLKKSNLDLVPLHLHNKVEFLENGKLPTNVSKELVAQGIAILTKPLKQPSITEFLDRYDQPEKELLILLDHVSDPQNIGSIFRSAAAFSVSGIITTLDNAPGERQSMVKAAVGAFESLPFIQINNLVNAIKILKQYGYWIIGLDCDTEKSLTDYKRAPREKTVLILGSEEKGLRELTKKHCDFLLKIPINRDVESLNVACAAAIALYKITQS